MHCPALLDDAISVGGFVSRCTTEPVETSDSGQYWTRHGDLHGPFCGQHDCSEADSCEANRYEQPWQGNVSFHNGAPDVLAPVHHPARIDGEPALQSGTSFGTGVVTGVLAAILGDLSLIETRPSPRELRHAVHIGSSPLDRGPLGKLDADRIWDELGNT